MRVLIQPAAPDHRQLRIPLRRREPLMPCEGRGQPLLSVVTLRNAKNLFMQKLPIRVKPIQ